MNQQVQQNKTLTQNNIKANKDIEGYIKREEEREQNEIQRKKLEANINEIKDPDYTQIYMFYNRKKNPNDKGKLKMHVYNKNNTSKSFYESFNDTINNAIEDVDDQLLFMNNYLSNNKKDESIVPTVKYIKNDIKSDNNDNIQFSKNQISEAELQKSIK